MMKRKTNIRFIISGLVMSLLMTSCTENKDEVKAPDTDALIGVMAFVESPMTTTRSYVTANPYQEVTPSSSKVLHASVWFSTSDNDFHDGGVADALPRHCEVEFNTDGMVYPKTNRMQYPASGTVYAVGLYPYSAEDAEGSKWENKDSSGASSNSHATRTITGEDDLMFAPQVWGTKANPISSALAFNHQLTWLKINVIAESHDAIDAWGNVENIKVTSPASKLTVSFSTNPATASFNYGTTTDIVAFDGSLPLKITSQELGSIFCAPTRAEESTPYSYAISIKTAKRAPKNYNIQLKDIEGRILGTEGVTTVPKGNLFVITLKFNEINMIDASCELIPWDDDSETLTAPAVEVPTP